MSDSTKVGWDSLASLTVTVYLGIPVGLHSCTTTRGKLSGKMSLIGINFGTTLRCIFVHSDSISTERYQHCRDMHRGSYSTLGKVPSETSYGPRSASRTTLLSRQHYTTEQYMEYQKHKRLLESSQRIHTYQQPRRGSKLHSKENRFRGVKLPRSIGIYRAAINDFLKQSPSASHYKETGNGRAA